MSKYTEYKMGFTGQSEIIPVKKRAFRRTRKMKKRLLCIILAIILSILSCDKNPSKAKEEADKFGLKIISPGNESSFSVGEEIKFIYRFENIPDTCRDVHFWWRSDRDDYFSGDSLCLENKLSKGNHIITIVAMENFEIISTDTISISIAGFSDLSLTELFDAIPAVNYHHQTIPIQTDEKDIRCQVDNEDFYYTVNNYISDGAKYWKNGEEVILSENPQAQALSIFVKDNNVYNCGKDMDSLKSFTQACYWINDTRYFLSDTFSAAYDICVNNDDIYVCGEEDSKACYWVNDEKYRIGEQFSKAKFIEVNEYGVFIGGEDWLTKYDYGVTVGWYWKNGIKTGLFYNEYSSDIEYSGTLNDMIVRQDTVYMTGRDNWSFAPLYWVNDHQVALKPCYSQSYRACSYSIDRVDQEIITGGTYQQKQCVWIDGIRVDF
ncbi:MAG: hypothetical protein JXQ65_11640 [Candidatus Marinimicrobia bacterium]|nr:hypothetical protein [Candidatus Neomarinimicrobiota bacterium]